MCHIAATEFARVRKICGGQRQKQPRKPDFFTVSDLPRPWGAHRPMPQPSAIPSQPPAGCPPRPASAAGTRAGVPLSVWPAIPPPAPCPGVSGATPCPHQVTTEAAARVITALSRPGDLVVIPAARTSALIGAAAAADRRVLGLCGDPALAARLARGLDPALRSLAVLRPGGPGLLLHATCSEAGQAALAVATACATPGCQPPSGQGEPPAEA